MRIDRDIGVWRGSCRTRKTAAVKRWRKKSTVSLELGRQRLSAAKGRWMRGQLGAEVSRAGAGAAAGAKGGMMMTVT
jgi:hypothetical protein